jgi:hypothetical protein
VFVHVATFSPSAGSAGLKSWLHQAACFSLFSTPQIHTHLFGHHRRVLAQTQP